MFVTQFTTGVVDEGPVLIVLGEVHQLLREHQEVSFRREGSGDAARRRCLLVARLPGAGATLRHHGERGEFPERSQEDLPLVRAKRWGAGAPEPASQHVADRRIPEQLVASAVRPHGVIVRRHPDAQTAQQFVASRSVHLYHLVTAARTATTRAPSPAEESRRSARSTYAGSTSTETEFRPVSIAARAVVPVPAKGSSTVSPAKLNIRMRRRGTSAGYGAGWSRLTCPGTPVQIGANHRT